MRLLLLSAVLSFLITSTAEATQTIEIVAVAQSADFQPGLAQPGSLSSLFVTGLQGEPGISTPSTYPLLNQLNGVTVTIDGLPAPILAIAFLDGYQQINIQVPWLDPAPKLVQVAQNGIQAATADIAQLNPASIFFSGAGNYGVIRHASDNSLVTPQNPAHPGEYLIAYAQNLAPVIATPPDGALTPPAPLPQSVPQFDSGCIGAAFEVDSSSTYLATPSYVGLAPNLVGVYQIDFQLPQSVSAADLSLSFVIAQWGVSQLPRCSPFFLKSRSVLLPVR